MASNWEIKHVLVTGSTGFIGAHIVDELLRRGIKVRAVARSHEKAERMLRDRPQYKDQLEFTFIGDLTDPNAFDDAAKGVDAIIHTASPVGYPGTGDVEAALMTPAIAGTKSILEAAKKEPTVKRIVLTSSFGAVVDPALGQAPGRTYTAADWCTLTYDAGKNSSANPPDAYRAGKKYAERAAWDYVRGPDADVHFDLVALCPPMVFGPVVHPVSRIADLGLTNAGLWSLSTQGAAIPAVYTPCWVDVRDLAYAHVEALVRPEVSNKRYTIAAPGHFTFQQAVNIVRREFPWAKSDGAEVEEKEPEAFFIEGETVAKDLGFQYRKFKDTVIDAIGQFREIQLHEKQTSES